MNRTTRFLSVFMLFSRSTVYHIAVILGILALLDSAMFYMHMRQNLPLEHITANCRWELIFVLCTLLMAALLRRYSLVDGKHSKTSYSWRCFRISPKALVLCRGFYNSICFALLWCWQIIVALILMRIFTETTSAYVNGQSIFLAFCRNPFLSALLPLGNPYLHLCNVILLLCLGFSLTSFPLASRKVSICGGIMLLAIFSRLNILSNMDSRIPMANSSDYIFVGVMALCTIAAMYFRFINEHAYAGEVYETPEKDEVSNPPENSPNAEVSNTSENSPNKEVSN